MGKATVYVWLPQAAGVEAWESLIALFYDRKVGHVAIDIEGFKYISLYPQGIKYNSYTEEAKILGEAKAVEIDGLDTVQMRHFYDQTKTNHRYSLINLNCSTLVTLLLGAGVPDSDQEEMHASRFPDRFVESLPSNDPYRNKFTQVASNWRHDFRKRFSDPSFLWQPNDVYTAARILSQFYKERSIEEASRRTPSILELMWDNLEYGVSKVRGSLEYLIFKAGKLFEKLLEVLYIILMFLAASVCIGAVLLLVFRAIESL